MERERYPTTAVQPFEVIYGYYNLFAIDFLVGRIFSVLPADGPEGLVRQRPNVDIEDDLRRILMNLDYIDSDVWTPQK